MYQYNGKEKQDELDLGWIDYGWRQYQPEIGRWNSIDPYSEKYFSYSPFAYTLNNPVNLIDPDGREVEDPDENTQCKNCNEGRIVIIYSPQQAEKIKKALADGDWNEVMRIVDYASSNGFVDGEGNSSTYIYRKICDCEGTEENGFSQTSALLISDDQGGREYINFFGVSIGEDGEAKFGFLGTKDFEKEKFNAWKDRYVKTGSTQDYEGLTEASRDLLMNRRIAGPRSDKPQYVNAGIGTNGGWSNTAMPHDGVVKMTEFFHDYKKDPQKYQQLVKQYVQYLQEVSKK